MADYTLKDIEPTQKIIEEDINRGLEEEQISRTLLWLVLEYNEVGWVYADQLQNFLGVDRMRAYRILEKFVGWRLLKKEREKNVVMFKPTFNNNDMNLKKWVKKAKYNIGLKK